jgi:hypothetical protein
MFLSDICNLTFLFPLTKEGTVFDPTAYKFIVVLQPDSGFSECRLDVNTFPIDEQQGSLEFIVLLVSE